MTIAYIIVGGSGSYSDRVERPIAAFLDKQAAEALLGALERNAKEYRGRCRAFPVTMAWNAEPRVAAHERAKAQAAAYGADLWEDYELVECPFRDAASSPWIAR